ncbi:MAG: hypothetical protein WCU88_00870 [Elusimicrobiota bacterium]
MIVSVIPAFAVHIPTTQQELEWALQCQRHIDRGNQLKEQAILTRKEQLDARSRPGFSTEMSAQADRAIAAMEKEQFIAYNKAIKYAMKAYGMPLENMQGYNQIPDAQVGRKITFIPVYLARKEVRPMSGADGGPLRENDGSLVKIPPIPQTRDGKGMVTRAKTSMDGLAEFTQHAFTSPAVLAATLFHESTHFKHIVKPGGGIERRFFEQEEIDTHKEVWENRDIFGLSKAEADDIQGMIDHYKEKLEERTKILEADPDCKKDIYACAYKKIKDFDSYPMQVQYSEEELAVLEQASEGLDSAMGKAWGLVQQARSLDTDAHAKEMEQAQSLAEKRVARQLLARINAIGDRVAAKQAEANKARELEAARNIMGSINTLGKKVTASQEARRKFLKDIRESADGCGFDVADIEEGVFRNRTTQTRIGFPYKLADFNSAEQAAVVNIGLMLANACMNRDPGWLDSACNDGMDDVARYWDRLNPGNLTALYAETSDSDIKSCVSYLVWHITHDDGHGRDTDYGNIKTLVKKYEDTYHPKAAPSSGRSSNNNNNGSSSGGNNIDRGNNSGGWEGRPLHLKTLPQIMHGL